MTLALPVRFHSSNPLLIASVSYFIVSCSPINDEAPGNSLPNYCTCLTVHMILLFRSVFMSKTVLAAHFGTFDRITTHC